MPRLILAFLFLILPLAEIAGFVIVGSEIGALATIGLVIASAMLGAIMMRVQGFNALQRAQAAVAAGGAPDREIIHGAMIVVAGILLMIPGFITDIIGLLLFIPFVRDLAWRALRPRITIVRAGAGQHDPFASGSRGPKVIDLDADDYQDVGNENSPWRRNGE